MKTSPTSFQKRIFRTLGQLEIKLPGMTLSVFADGVALDTDAGVTKYQFVRNNVVTMELELQISDGTFRQVHNEIMAWANS